MADLTEASEIVLARPPRWARASIYLMALLLLSAAAWTYVGTVDLVIRAPGIVRPEGEVVRVQSEVPGRVRELAVREGEEVQAGQCLLRLDASELEIEREKLRAQRRASESRLAQLRSDLGKREAEGQAQIARLRIAEAEAEAALTLTQREAKAREEERRAALDAAIAAREAATKKWETTKKLNEKGLASDQELLKDETDRRRAIADEARARALANVGSEDVTVAQKIVELRSKELEIFTLQLKRELEALKEGIRAAEKELSDAGRDLETSGHRIAKTEIRAAAAGMVTSLNVRAAGEVVIQGQTLMTIAPKGARLVMEARVANRDIGSVKPDLPVKMKFHAFPYQDYALLTGKVMRIAPDAVLDPRHGNVYEVTVSLDRMVLTEGADISLGMTADVEIVKERVRILNLLLRKLRKRS